jgi:hypothetical protein
MASAAQRPPGLSPLRTLRRQGQDATAGEKVTGRKTKLTPELQEQLVDALAAGAYAETACDYVGISTTTYYRWLQLGEQGERDLQNHPKLDDTPDTIPYEDRYRLLQQRRRRYAEQARQSRPFREFRDAVTRASARAEVSALATLRTAVSAATRAVVVPIGQGMSEVQLVPDHDARAKAAIEFLKRRFPDRWTDRQRVEHAGGLTVTDERFDTSDLSEQDKAELSEHLLALKSAGLLNE